MFLSHFDVFCDIHEVLVNRHQHHRFILLYIYLIIQIQKQNVKTTISHLCRKFLQEVMEETLGEVVDSRSFDSLVKAVNTEKEKKAGLQQTILKYVHVVFCPECIKCV